MSSKRKAVEVTAVEAPPTRGEPLVTGGPLGPGDSEPNEQHRGEPITAAPPLGPGDADPNDKVNRNVRMLAQPAAGPGDTYVARRLTVFPIKEKD